VKCYTKLLSVPDELFMALLLNAELPGLWLNREFQAQVSSAS